MIEFGSKSRISGCNTLKLVTTCIYQWSRNLQYLGWFLVLLGISFIGRSGLALLYAIIGIVLFHFYITRIKEAHLKRKFKEKYISGKKSDSTIHWNIQEKAYAKCLKLNANKTITW